MTFTEGVAGFLIACLAGVLLGVGIHCSRTAYAALFPLLTAAQTLPLISIAPLFLIWFGFEPAGKIVIVAVFALFPIVVQTMRGLQAVPRFYDDVAMTCGASRAWTLFHVDLRVAARQIFGHPDLPDGDNRHDRGDCRPIPPDGVTEVLCPTALRSPMESHRHLTFCMPTRHARRPSASGSKVRSLPPHGQKS